jgi:hypothetical protein
VRPAINFNSTYFQPDWPITGTQPYAKFARNICVTRRMRDTSANPTQMLRAPAARILVQKHDFHNWEFVNQDI